MIPKRPQRFLMCCLAALTLSAGLASAALVNPVLNAPIFNFNSTGTTTYDATSDQFNADALVLAVTLPDGTFAFVDGSRPFAIRLLVDAAGVASSNGSVDDLSVTGSIDVDGNGSYEFTGLLLSGSLKSFGFQDSGGNTDSFDFVFEVTGGSMADYFDAGDIGVTLTSENSTFAGFEANFAGQAKGDVGLVLKPLTIACADALGEIGVQYDSALVATGGLAPYTFSITEGSLPAGLTLQPDGTISGIPTAVGSAAFTAQVVDSSDLAAGTVATQCTVTIAPPPLGLACAEATGQVGVPYVSALVATGGVAPYTFSITIGSLAPGLTLGENGSITGTPTAAGTFPFTAQVVDSSGLSADTAAVECSLVIAPPPLGVICAGTTGQVGQPYSAVILASGGVAPYTFSITAGSLPPGLTLHDDGTIDGTPTEAGAYPYTVQVVDASGGADNTASGECELVIAPPPLSLICAGGSGRVGTPYESAMVATGGLAPYTFSLVGGALPPGLTLNPDGTITGTPTAAGDFSYAVQVVDSSGSSAGSVTTQCNIKTTPGCSPNKISGAVKCTSCKPIPGVTVTLYDADNQVKGSATTNYYGRYSFGNLPEGTYTVTITVPAGYQACGETSKVITLGCGQCKTIDFCVCPVCTTAKVYGTVKCSSSCKTITGVTVKLFDSSNAEVRSTLTNCWGQYSFSNLPEGDYTIKIIPPAGYEPCGETAKTAKLICGQCKTVDFCVCPACTTAKITGTVKCTSPCKVIPNVTVVLLDSANVQKGTTKTNCQGQYAFSNLAAGSYTVQVQVPSGYEACGETSKVVAVTCTKPNVADFCVCPVCSTAKLSGTVKCSSNGKALANVVVKLFDANNVEKASAKTNCYGQYAFCNLPAGTYSVQVTVETGYEACDETSKSVTLVCGQTTRGDFCICKTQTQETGTQGCTPGYWKNHMCRWPSEYKPSDSFNQVFGVRAFSSCTSLGKAVGNGGGGINALGRHAVAALLNSAHSRVDFGATPEQIITIVQVALAPGGDIEGAKNTLAAMNERGCPLN